MTTPATEALAKTMATISLQALGYTKTMIDRMWTDDTEGRQVFLDGAELHATAIKAEALNEAADGWQAYIRAMNMGTNRPVGWLRDRAKLLTALTVTVTSQRRSCAQGGE